MTDRDITFTPRKKKRNLCDPYRQRREQDGRLVIYVYRTSKYSAPGPLERSLYDNVLRSPSNITYSLSLSLFYFFYTYPSIYSPISKFEFSHYFPHRFSLSPDNNHHDIPSFLSLLFLRFGKKKLCHLLYHNYSTTFENRREL